MKIQIEDWYYTDKSHTLDINIAAETPRAYKFTTELSESKNHFMWIPKAMLTKLENDTYLLSDNFSPSGYQINFVKMYQQK